MRKLLINFLAYFGFAIVRIPRIRRVRKETVIGVGGFDLFIPTINPLIHTYAKNKDFASEFGRLVNATYTKYPNLGVIDVGANIGDTVATIKSHKDIPVVSFEGEPFTFSFLKRNVQQFKDVQIFNHYLGESNKSITVNLQNEGWNTTIIPSPDHKKTIELFTLDHLLFNAVKDVNGFKLLKIDTEGFDTIILRGATKFISQIHPVIFMEYNRENMEAIGEDGFSTVLRMEELGYDRILLYDDRGRFMFATSLLEKKLLNQMHHYADGKAGLVSYFNLCLLHRDDADLEPLIIDQELLHT